MDDRREKTLKTQYKVLKELHPHSSHTSILELLSSYEGVKVEELSKLIPDPTPATPARVSTRR